MHIPTIEEVQTKAKEYFKDIHIKEKDVRYSDSLNFYLTNDFYYEECWNLDVTLAYLILPRLIHFRHNHCGYPSCFGKFDEDGSFIADDDGSEKWDNILDSMIAAFWLLITVEFPSKESQIIIDTGLKNFGEYFQLLWD